MRMNVDGSALAKLIIGELTKNVSLSKWEGEGLKITRWHHTPTEEEREAIQKLGDKAGCHTCGTNVKKDSDQPWIGDHIPPTNLSLDVRLVLKLGLETYLFPQCHECMHIQANLVTALNNATTQEQVKDLLETDYHQGLIWRKPGKNCIKTTLSYVSPDQGLQIQMLGTKFGCHSCGAEVPAQGYHADHVFPQEFCTPYMEKVFKALGLADWYPKEFFLRPQCPRCSSNQGGSMSQITSLAMRYATESGIPMYKV